jgi:hypothetical protein
VQQCLDCAPFIRRAVALCHLFQEQVQVEDLPGIDFSTPDQVDQLGQEVAHRGEAAVQINVRGEELSLGISTLGSMPTNPT